MMETLNSYLIENIIVIVILFVFAILFFRTFFKDKKITLLSREALSFREILEFSPDAFFVWLYDNKKNAYPFASRKLSIMFGLEKGRNTGFEDVASKIEDGEKLLNSIDVLQKEGDRFFKEIKLKDKDRYFICEGNKIVTFGGEELATIIWFKDITERYVAYQNNKDTLVRLENEKKYYEEIIDALPFPLWVRNDGQLVSDCNQSYVSAVEAISKDDVQKNHIELGQGGDVKEIRALSLIAKKDNAPQCGIFPIILNSQLKNIEINEAVIDASQTIGWAREVTTKEHEFTEILEKKEIFQETLKQHPTGVLVLDEKQYIKTYNDAFLKIWGISDDFMSSCPGLEDLLRELKQLRMLPENRDFSVYKEQVLKFYTTIDTPHSDTVYLPKGVVIRRSIVPMENGGTITYFEDVTNQTTLERDFYSLTESYKTMLDNVTDAVVIFGDNGRFKMANSSFFRLWNFNKESIDNLRLSEVLELKKQFFDKKYNWTDVKSEMLSHISSGVKQVMTMERNDNKVIDCANIRLVDGSIMISYVEVKKS